MDDLYLKADSKEVFYQACSDAGLLNKDGELISSTKDYCIVEIGRLFSRVDEENETEIEGYHVNVRSEIELGIEHLAIEVENPLVVWS